VTSRFSSAASNLPWIASGKSAISSRYKVPPLAEPNQPARLLAVPPWLPAL
jgi:hypothetical protein